MATNSDDFQAIRQIRLELRHLRRKYLTANDWIPRLQYSKPDTTPEGALRSLRERMDTLRKQLAKHNAERIVRPKHDLERGRSTLHFRKKLVHPQSPPRTTGEWMPVGPPSLSATLQSHQSHPENWWQEWDGTAPNPDVREGVAPASGCQQYVWKPSDDNRLWDFQFWDDPDMGFSFLARVEAEPGILYDLTALLSAVAVVQYTFPEAPWNGVLRWQVVQNVNFECVGEGDAAGFRLYSIVEPRRNEDWPPTRRAARHFFHLDNRRVIHALDGEEFDVPISVDEVFSGEASVAPGDVIRVYLGILLDVFARDGWCEAGFGPYGRITHQPNSDSWGVWYSLLRL